MQGAISGASEQDPRIAYGRSFLRSCKANRSTAITPKQVDVACRCMLEGLLKTFTPAELLRDTASTPRGKAIIAACVKRVLKQPTGG